MPESTPLTAEDPAVITLLMRNQVFKRRAAVRYRCHLGTFGRLATTHSEESHVGWAQNLSVTGIGLLLGQALDSGTEVVIELKSLTQEATFQLAARVVHCTQQGNGEWLLGC